MLVIDKYRTRNYYLLLFSIDKTCETDSPTRKKQFKKFFKDERRDRFKHRFIILDVFFQTEQHVTVNELCDFLEENGLKYESDFVKKLNPRS